MGFYTHLYNYMYAGHSGEPRLTTTQQSGKAGCLRRLPASFGPVIADISLWFERRRGVAVAICSSGSYLAGASWPLIIQPLAESAGWRQTYLGIGVFSGCHDEDEQGAWIGRRQVANEPFAKLCLAFAELLDAADYHGPTFCQHRRRIDERVEGLRRQIKCVACVDVEVAAFGYGGIEERANGLVLEDIFVAVEQISEIEGA